MERYYEQCEQKDGLLEYLVDIKHWYEGMKACARYEGAMLVGKYIESNKLRRLRLYRLKVANCLRDLLRSLTMACRMLVRPYNERQLLEPPGEVIELICCLACISNVRSANSNITRSCS